MKVWGSQDKQQFNELNTKISKLTDILNMLSQEYELKHLQQEISDYCSDNFVPQELKPNIIESIESFKQKK